MNRDTKVKTLNDIFRLAEVISKLKESMTSSWRFESSSDKLKTEITIWAGEEPFPLEVQTRYAKINSDIKELVRQMISELEQERDNLMLSYMSRQSVQENIDDIKPSEEE